MTAAPSAMKTPRAAIRRQARGRDDDAEPGEQAEHQRHLEEEPHPAASLTAKLRREPTDTRDLDPRRRERLSIPTIAGKKLHGERDPRIEHHTRASIQGTAKRRSSRFSPGATNRHASRSRYGTAITPPSTRDLHARGERLARRERERFMVPDEPHDQRVEEARSENAHAAATRMAVTIAARTSELRSSSKARGARMDPLGSH